MNSKAPLQLARFAAGILFVLGIAAIPVRGAAPAAAPAAKPDAPAAAEPLADSLGRNTPRGTVLGFLVAARTGQNDIAVQYLNTPLKGESATRLALQLFAVLDRRLPPRLTQLSDKPEGSVADPLRTNEDKVGEIESDSGTLSINVERVIGKSGIIWLFSQKTLDAIPAVYDEIDRASLNEILPDFMMQKRFLGVLVANWVLILVGMPVFYYLTVLLNRLLSPVAGALRRRWRKDRDLPNPVFLPAPARLLLLALAIRWMIHSVSLPLLGRQLWASISVVLAVAACVWLFILLNSWTEQYSYGFARKHDITGITAVVRLVRRFVDLLVIFAGIMGILYYFGVNPTAVVAGLGVGGIAVALAAQKTLENVIGGISLIVDKVVLVGDTLKVAGIEGTVEDLGLRSTRIRTNDRTVVSLPNGQIANMTLENLSNRDKFWFHPLLSLDLATTSAQLDALLDDIRNEVSKDLHVEPDSVRASLLRIGTSALEVDVAAYIVTRKGADFLRIQEALLLSIMKRIESAGVKLAMPSPTVVIDSSAATRPAGASDRV